MDEINTILQQQQQQPIQPSQYSTKELSSLRDFVKVIMNDDSRSALACWGNYSDYSHGY